MPLHMHTSGNLPSRPQALQRTADARWAASRLGLQSLRRSAFTAAKIGGQYLYGPRGVGRAFREVARRRATTL